MLPVIQINTREFFGNNGFEESFKHNKSIGAKFYVQGGIYIFGRVDNQEDIEKYREKIFKFVQYMKETDTFEYTDLAFYIIDERSLTDRFQEEIGDKLVEARREIKTADEFIAYRNELLDTLDDDFKKMTKEEVDRKIEGFSRSYLLEMWEQDYNKYSVMRHTVVRSFKYLEIESRLSKYKKLEYLDKSENRLLNTMKINYREYDREKLYNHEWED